MAFKNPMIDNEGPRDEPSEDLVLQEPGIVAFALYDAIAALVSLLDSNMPPVQVRRDAIDRRLHALWNGRINKYRRILKTIPADVRRGIARQISHENDLLTTVVRMEAAKTKEGKCQQRRKCTS